MRSRDMLRPAQRRTVEELCRSLGVILVVPMGGGKTVTALTAAGDLIRKGTIRAAIVVAPKRVALTAWPQDKERWEQTAGLDLVVLKGSPAQRLKLLKEKHDIYVCGIDNIVWLLDVLHKMKADDPRLDQLIIDEVSRFANPRGERSKYLRHRTYRFKAIWGLTGTPRPGKWDKLWSPLQIISNGEAFGEQGFDDWQRANFRPLDYQQRKWEVHSFAVNDIMRTVNEWCVAVPPEDCASVPFTSGPEYDTILPLNDPQRVACEELTRELETLIGQAPETVSADDEDTIKAMNAAVASGQISQVLQGFSYVDGETAAWWNRAKEDALAELREAANGENLTIVYNYREDLEAIRRVLGRDVPTFAGLGDTATIRLMDKWNAGDVENLALHPASAGHGLELQFGGHRLIWYCMTWSQELYAQTIKRLARSGQTRPVFSHRILMNHWQERLRVARVEAGVLDELDFISQIRKV